MYKKYWKRIIDLVLAVIAAVLLLPLHLLISIAIKLDSKGPVIFKQKRIGINKSLFDILKYRTMRIDAPHDVPTHQLSDPEWYITKIGRVLRKTSLDELPQIINILIGQMAIVGPRPALWNQDDLVAERDRYGANGIRPGLTGWAQINGRDELEIPVKAKLDGEYLNRMSFLFDLKCLISTIGSVVRHRGIVEGGARLIDHQQEDSADE